MELSQETQAYAMSLATGTKSQADQRAQVAFNQIGMSALMDMFLSGYNRALVDHGIMDSIEEGDIVEVNDEENGGAL